LGPKELRPECYSWDAPNVNSKIWSGPPPAAAQVASLEMHDLVVTGHLRLDERDRFVATIRRAAEAGRFSMALTMFAATARVPKRR